MTHFSPTEHPHRRYNPLLDEWILVSPHRAKRPWQGQNEPLPETPGMTHDPGCYLCPRNERAGGQINPDYQNVWSFDNDFPALLRESYAANEPTSPFFRSLLERGINKVICFSPRHDLTLAEMETAEITAVVQEWKRQYTDLGALDFINYVQIFENKGAMMGCSNPHPHGQIWAQSSIPTLALKTQNQLRTYYDRTGNSLLQEYLEQERSQQERIVYENQHFTVLVPFWATWPFETLIIPHQKTEHIALLDEVTEVAFADAIRAITVKYDNLFQSSFPYSSGIHQAPTDRLPHPEWHFHMHFYPPLLRSATVRKFMVGYELLGEAQRDLTPEQAAATLRALSTRHYRKF